MEARRRRGGLAAAPADPAPEEEDAEQLRSPGRQKQVAFRDRWLGTAAGDCQPGAPPSLQRLLVAQEAMESRLTEVILQSEQRLLAVLREAPEPGGGNDGGLAGDEQAQEGGSTASPASYGSRARSAGSPLQPRACSLSKSYVTGTSGGWPKDLVARRFEAGGDQLEMPCSLEHLRSRSTRDLTQASAAAPVAEHSSWAASVLSARDPSAAYSITLKIVGVCILAADLTITPFVVSWGERMTSADDALLHFSRLSALYWTVDMWSSFFLGFYSDGRLITEQKAIVKRYVAGWFTLDLLLVCGDWWQVLTFAVGSDAEAAGVKWLRVAKLAKIARVLALVRAMRFFQFLREWAEMMWTDFTRRCVRILAAAFVCAWATHSLGCFWFFVGEVSPTDTGERWTNRFNLEDSSILSEYVTCVHWAMTMLTLGSIDIASTNTMERVFTVICLVAGLIGSSIIVSTISSGMVEAHMASAEQDRKLTILRRFLRENSLSRGLVRAVNQQVAERMSRQEKLRERDVSALAFLSSALRYELRFEVMGSSLSTHALFRFFIAFDFRWSQRALMDAVDVAVHQPHDDLFLPGSQAFGAYYLETGDMHYTQDPLTSRVETTVLSQVQPATWIAEAALWIDWSHVGHAQAYTECQLLTVSARMLAMVLKISSRLSRIASNYAQLFHAQLTASVPPTRPWPTDLHVSNTTWPELAVCMDAEWQTAITEEAFVHLTRTAGKGFFRHQLARPQDFVDAQDWLLVVQGDGQAEFVRMAVQCRLHPFEGGEGMLVQLGHCRGGQAFAELSLPSLSRLVGESVAEAGRRLLEVQLGFLSGLLDQEDSYDEVVADGDLRQGLPSKLVRRVEVFRLSAPFEEAIGHVGAALGEESHVRRVGFPQSFCALGLEDWVKELPVYFAPDAFEGGGTYYCWLDDDEVSLLQTPAGERQLSLLLASLEPISPDGSLIRRASRRASASGEDLTQWTGKVVNV